MYSVHLDKYPEKYIAFMNLFKSIFNLFILLDLAIFCNSPFAVFKGVFCEKLFLFLLNIFTN